MCHMRRRIHVSYSFDYHRTCSYVEYEEEDTCVI
jgi:hypothetical protein